MATNNQTGLVYPLYRKVSHSSFLAVKAADKLKSDNLK